MDAIKLPYMYDWCIKINTKLVLQVWNMFLKFCLLLTPANIKEVHIRHYIAFSNYRGTENEIQNIQFGLLQIIWTVLVSLI
jgi:hypothetical protein